MRRTSAVLAILWYLPWHAHALERSPARMSESERSSRAWNAGCTSTIAYYNLCSGWIWIWSDWAPESRVGVTFTGTSQCTDNAWLQAHWMYVWTGSPAGYGYTGEISVYEANRSDRCPRGAPLHTQPFLPTSGWQAFAWGVADRHVLAIVATLGPGENNPVAFPTDQPGATVEGGGLACGVCFPVTRSTHSFRFGTASSTLCPGLPLFDGACDAELLWEAVGTIVDDTIPVSVTPLSWGGLKALYR